MKDLKKYVSGLLALSLITFSVLTASAENADTPPEPPQGEVTTDGQTPPERPDGDMGTPPDIPGGAPAGMPASAMGTPPEGGMGGPGGGSSQPSSYEALASYSENTELNGVSLASTGDDENALLVTGGTVTVSGSTLSRVSDNSTGGDSASFYGVGAAVLVTDGEVHVTDSEITTDASGGAGVFAYGDGVAYVENTTIRTEQNTSGGIHVAGGGTLYAKNLDVITNGGSAAAIRSDRGSGTMVVDGGTYTSNGSGSPAVYVTADITLRDASLTATGSEALCLEGLNTVRLYNCTLEGDMPQDAQNDNTWTVILYQSMSGDSQVGEGTFIMDGGSLVSHSGGLFYSTNTDSVFTLRNVEIITDETPDYFLRVTGNSNARGWGSTGSNGANTVFTAYQQTMNGDILYDSISNLTLYLLEGTHLTGAVLDDESCAGNGENGTAAVAVDATSTWTVTENSTLTSLACEGTLQDADGRTVSVLGNDGTVYIQGESDIVIYVDSFSDTIDISSAGIIPAYDAMVSMP